jgi:ligand-binding sensor domain-containing protein
MKPGSSPISRCISALLLAWAALALLAAPLPAQEPSWQTFTTAAGLPDGQVTAVTQDGDGRLWVGTAAGLSHYFGGQFRQEESLPAGLVGGRIWALEPAAGGELWAASNAGLFERQPSGEWRAHTAQQTGMPLGEIWALLWASDGRLWAGSIDGDCGLAAWNPVAGTWQLVEFPGFQPCVTALGQDAFGRVWAAGLLGTLVLAPDGEGFVLDESHGIAAGSTVGSIWPEEDGRVWLASDQGLLLIDEGRLASHLTGAGGTDLGEVTAMTGDGRGGLWLGTTEGVVNLAGDTVAASYSRADGLAGGAVRALYADRDGNLWVGSDMGLTRLPVNQWWSERDSLLVGQPVRALLPGTAAGDAAALSAGVALRGQDGRWRLVTRGLCPGEVMALAAGPDGQLWAGATCGLHRLEGAQFRLDERLPPGTAVNALLFDRQGALWVASHQGLFRLSGESADHFGKLSGELGQDSVLCLAETAVGDIWAGTLNGGASRFRDGQWLLVSQQNSGEGLADDIILSLMEDTAGDMWIATSGGLSTLSSGADPFEAGSWRTFREPLIAGDRVNALWLDQVYPDRVWVGTEGGLSLIAAAETSRFTRDDGLLDNQLLSLAQDEAGRLWLGTAAGLVYHQDAGQGPQIELAELLVDNTSCDDDCAGSIDFRANSSTFAYLGSDLGDPDALSYYVTQQETTSSGQQIITTTLTKATSISQPLTPGSSYTLSVRAMDRHFNSSPEMRTSVMRVNTPTFWQRLTNHPQFWLIALVTLAVVSLVGGGAGVRGYQAWQRTQRFPYNDLLVTIADGPAGPAAKLAAKRVSILPASGPLAPLFHWTAWLGSPRPVRLGRDECPLDLGMLAQARTLWRQLEGSPAEAALPLTRSLGELLYQGLFASPELAGSLETQLGLGRQGLRLRLPYGAHPALDGLPWEFLHGGDRLGYLGRQPRTCLVRYRQPAEGWQPPPAGERLRVLVVMAQPSEADVASLGLAASRRYLDHALSGLENVTHDYLLGANAAHLVRPEGDGIEERAAHLPLELAQRLQEGWDVVHFAGHAGPDRLAAPGVTAETVLWFEDKRGEYLPLGGEQLRQMLAPLTAEGKLPKLVLLEACDTASVDSDLLHAILDSGVAAVVGMQWPVLDTAAQRFAAEFYRTLGRHGQVDHALALARGAMSGQGSGEQIARHQWAAPVLVMQSETGLIFESAAKGA